MLLHIRALHEVLPNIVDLTVAHPKRQREEGDREKCANTIKEFWKKFGKRHKEQKQQKAEKILIGMKPVPFATSFLEKVENTLKRRKE
jgi:hypothetical protein